MEWSNSVFNDERSPRESWHNRDSDTHMPIERSDVFSPRDTEEWERDLVEAESEHFALLSEQEDNIE